jgi:hypothetical protein
MGAGRITLYGADFCYPRGKPYARGTYVYDVFGDVARRTEPVEAAVYAFILRSSDARAEPSGGHLRYRTGLLSSYRERLLAYVAGSGARLVAVPGQGLPLDVSVNGGASRPSGEDGRALSESAGVPAPDWRNVLEQYAESLARLPGLADPPWASLAAMQPAQIEAWGTILPVAACVARETRGIGESAALESARRWALDRVTRTLGAWSPFGQE